MNFVEPIRDRKKIAQIKNLLRGEKRYRDLLLFVVGINTALRIYDLLGLQIGQILDDRGRILQRFWIKEQKRGKRHEVVIYDFHEVVPDHSSLTKIRERFGLETFQKFFEHIVTLCVEAGLVWGEELYFDSTKVNANAAIDGLIPRMGWEAQQHLQQLFEARLDSEETLTEIPPPYDEDFTPDLKVGTFRENATSMSPTQLVTKYKGTRLTGVRKPSYDRIADQKVCPTDPDASPMKPSGGGSAVLGYKDHYIVDGENSA